MAGNYPDVPGRRMALDRDGSIALLLNMAASTTIQTLSSTLLNDESSSPFFDFQSADETAVCVIFPELRDLVGHHIQFRNGTGWATNGIETSANTTNGFDGTWTSRGAWSFRDFNREALRTAIDGASWLGVKAIRYRFLPTGSFGTLHTVHLYGSPATGQAPNRLRLWHPTLDQEVDGAYFDWDDVSRGTVLDRDFRVKNPSASLTANSVSISMEALTDANPTNVSQHAYSLDGTNFSASVNVGNLGPGVISPIIRLRRTTSASAALSLWWTRIVASASSYT